MFEVAGSIPVTSTIFFAYQPQVQNRKLDSFIFESLVFRRDLIS